MGLVRLGACFLFSIAVLTACEQSGSRSISGVQTTHSEWRDISRDQSVLRFEGENRPDAFAWQYRLRDNGNMVQERAQFTSRVHTPVSGAFLEMVTAGRVFNDETTRLLKDKTRIRGRFERMLARTGEFEIKDGANANGRFLYAVVDLGKDRCIAAIQGLVGDPVGYVKALPGQRFQAVVEFSYCNDRSEQGLLDVFATFRPKFPS
jgi:hypothetical protein